MAPSVQSSSLSATSPATSPSTALPKTRIGIIGGGQLAWMMGPAAQKLGLSLQIQTPSETDPAVAIANQTQLGAIQDIAATQALAAQSDVITFENEFVDLAALEALAAAGTTFAPALKSLLPLLDKFDQRSYLQQQDIPVPRFIALETVPERDRPTWQNPLGFPVVLKARRLGYDGQGTSVIETAAALRAVLEREGFDPFLLEAFVPFERELAIMAAQSSSGEIVTYPVVETKQENQVCAWVLAPAAVSDELRQEVEAIARRILTGLDFVGILGVELFQTSDDVRGDQVQVNEIAPRTHNSGHYSLDACTTSQFEQQLRAVSDRPLGSAELTVPGAVMINLLGYESVRSDYVAQRQQLADLPNAHLYWYGKAEARPGRKLGHVTINLSSGDSAARKVEAERAIAAVRQIWPNANH